MLQLTSRTLFGDVKVDLKIIKYLFYIFILTFHEPDLLGGLIKLIHNLGALWQP